MREDAKNAGGRKKCGGTQKMREDAKNAGGRKKCRCPYKHLHQMTAAKLASSFCGSNLSGPTGDPEPEADLFQV